MAAIVDGFLQDAERILEQLQQPAERRPNAEAEQLLESLRESAAMLGFAQGALECRQAMRSLPQLEAALPKLRRSLQLNVARSLALLSSREPAEAPLLRKSA